MAHSPGSPMSRLLSAGAGMIGRVPASLAAWPGRRRGVNDRGQPLDPHLSLLIWAGELTGAVMAKSTVEDARSSGRKRMGLIQGRPRAVARVSDEVLSDGTRVRV